MLILGMDSTAVTASVALAEVKDGALISHSVFTVKNKMTHSENLMPMVDHILQVYGAKVSDLELLAVNAGPGSFTGVRIGVATVKGLAFPKGLPCAPVSTLDSLAENLKDIPGTVCALMDARRNQFYYAIFEDGVRQTPDSCGSFEEISAMLTGKNAMLCGDGAAVFASLFAEECPHTVANPVIREQNALSVALCGYRMFTEGKTVSGKELRPIYLRVPQAERERLERMNKGE
jgi:tRNA threonylcarbamoyladenosine biosynthesis protein TsaB